MLQSVNSYISSLRTSPLHRHCRSSDYCFKTSVPSFVNPDLLAWQFAGVVLGIMLIINDAIAYIRYSSSVTLVKMTVELCTDGGGVRPAGWPAGGVDPGWWAATSTTRHSHDAARWSHRDRHRTLCRLYTLRQWRAPAASVRLQGRSSPAAASAILLRLRLRPRRDSGLRQSKLLRQNFWRSNGGKARRRRRLSSPYWLRWESANFLVVSSSV